MALVSGRTGADCDGGRGPGVPPDQREAIFERCERADQKSKGLGLGLSIVRNVVEAHEGTVEVSDTPGSGVVFRLRFPPIAMSKATAS